MLNLMTSLATPPKIGKMENLSEFYGVTKWPKFPNSRRKSVFDMMGSTKLSNIGQKKPNLDLLYGDTFSGEMMLGAYFLFWLLQCHEVLWIHDTDTIYTQ